MNIDGILTSGKAKIMRTSFCWIMLVLVVSAASVSWGMEISKDGKATAVIVVQGDSTAAPAKQAGKSRGARRSAGWDDAEAAKILAAWIEKITGAKLALVDRAPEGAAAIYVGAAAVQAGLKLDDIDSPNHEGLRLVSDGQRVLIGGQSPAATAKAVCLFLEKLGCRYLMPGPLGEVYPRTQDLSVEEFEVTSTPGFLMRKLWVQDELWKTWNGCGGSSFSTGHSRGGYAPKDSDSKDSSDIFAAHPEYFPFRNGKRALTTPAGWLCTSNPEVRRIFAENLVRKIQAGDLYPSISPPDGRGYCECPACQAQDDPNSREPSSGVISKTNRYVGLYLYLSEQAAKANPQAVLNFYCYADYTIAPTNVKQLPANLCPWIAPIRYCHSHGMDNPNCPSRQSLKQVIDDWGAIAKTLGYRPYDYNLGEVCAPFSRISILKQELPYLKKKGIAAINYESAETWPLYGPSLYLTARLMYDPMADTDAVMDDYFLNFFGPQAGPFMKKYWMDIDRAIVDLNTHAGGFIILHLIYTDELLAGCREQLKQAAAAAGDDPILRKRVELNAAGLRNVELYLQVRRALIQGDATGAKKAYQEMHASEESQVQAGVGWAKQLEYARRFVGNMTDALAEAVAPGDKVLQVLPDEWSFAWDQAEEGLAKGFSKSEFDDSGWQKVLTYGKPLDAQGLPDKLTVLWYRTRMEVSKEHDTLGLFFLDVDGGATVYVNGQAVDLYAKDKEGKRAKVDFAKKRVPFEADISAAVRPGVNTVAVRVDHKVISGLSLGGIVRPVLLIERPGKTAK